MKNSKRRALAWEALGQLDIAVGEGRDPSNAVAFGVLLAPFVSSGELRGGELHAAINELSHPLIAKEMAERWNIKYFGPTFLPAYEFMGNKRIASVSDMKGVKMRISGLNAQALQKFGAVPTLVTTPTRSGIGDRRLARLASNRPAATSRRTT